MGEEGQTERGVEWENPKAGEGEGVGEQGRERDERGWELTERIKGSPLGEPFSFSLSALLSALPLPLSAKFFRGDIREDVRLCLLCFSFLSGEEFRIIWLSSENKGLVNGREL